VDAVTASALYEGTIRHRRFAVRRTEFTHRLALAYLDLDELPGLLGGMLVRRSAGLVRFRRSDYLGDPEAPLADAVRALVEEQTGRAPDGPVRMLTNLRTFGHCFNPVSFYYCHAAGGGLDTLVAEVTNTPWGERHAYVLPSGAPSLALRAGAAKALHVSPFMGMEQAYEVRANAPADTLAVHIESRERDARVFDATLKMRRRPLTHRTLAEVTIRHPAATLRVMGLIYLHAAGLRLRGVRLRPRPARTRPARLPVDRDGDRRADQRREAGDRRGLGRGAVR
jgi:hypothetical protein